MDFLALYSAQFQILAYVGLAMLLGAAIGLEREFADKPAGLRTHMLVTGATTLAVEGLATAASILFATAVGLCVALSQLVLAVAVTVLVLITLRGVGIFQRRIGTSKH